MATFKITEILRLGTDGPHTHTDWCVVRNNDRDNPISESLNDNENLIVLRKPLFERDGSYLDDCEGITCIVRVKINNKWSDEFILEPITHDIDI